MADINQKVLQFARQKLGTRVYTALDGALGECWDLAFAAQVSASAMTPHDYGSTYKWSSKTVSLSQARPGDIIQYKNFKIKVTKTEPNGSWTSETSGLGSPHHTAIIKMMKSNGQVEAYEQNIGDPPNKKVHVNTYYLKPGTYTEGSTKVKVEKLGGRFTIYRPLKKIQQSALIVPSRDIVPVFSRPSLLEG